MLVIIVVVVCRTAGTINMRSGSCVLYIRCYRVVIGLEMGGDIRLVPPQFPIPLHIPPDSVVRSPFLPNLPPFAIMILILIWPQI